MGVRQIRLKGLFVLGATALSLGYVVPGAGLAQGPPVELRSVPAGSRAELPVAGRTDGLLAGEQTPLTAITLHDRGGVYTGRVLAPDVGRALRELGVEPAPDDRIRVRPPGAPTEVAASPSTPLVEGMLIHVVRMTREVTRRSVALAFGSREVRDADLDVGVTRVEEGKQGEAIVVTEIVFEDGRPAQSRVLAEETTRPARDRVVHVGTRPPPLPVDSSYRFTKVIASHNVTAYCLTGTTATGTQAGPGSIAVDPSVIKLGSHLYVEGYGFGWAVDTGSAIKGDAIDVWKTCDQAVAWGRRASNVYVLDH